MVLSGLAVVFVPMIMMNMHGGHDMSSGANNAGGHAPMDHSSSSAMISDADNTTRHDMSQMDHSMHNMNDDSATMENTQ